MPAPVTSLLGKNMLVHITGSLALGTVAAYGYWHSIVLEGRTARTQYYQKLRSEQA
ncbi:hypothetical protein BGZ76_011769 [Entomortierella beljakovae]|nr:hypothetical protein BGZ76_011769 [Entomortierella beljakovae]